MTRKVKAANHLRRPPCVLTERGGFEQARFAKLFLGYYLQCKSGGDKDFSCLHSLLFSHGFLPF